MSLEFDDLESSYDRYKVPLPQPSSMDYGAYLRKMREEQRREAQARQREWEQLGGDRVPSRHSQRGGMYVSWMNICNKNLSRWAPSEANGTRCK